MPTLNEWLSEYGQSHKNETNKTIHWICVPTIFFSIVGLLYSIKLTFLKIDFNLNVAMIAIIGVIAYYFSLSKTLWIGMLIFGAVCLGLCYLIERSGILPLWMVSLALFVAAWLAQFYGHKIEGAKPSFLKDLQFLMIGPAWLMSFIYQRLGINY
ncbi:MAG: Mpo1-like protein [Bacteroidota bacterium]